ncbi:MAG: valine--tRNA ligase [Bacteroidales bacterium]|nr:valine--tRNA ligase [Bacteroidales bacterium]MDY6347379.1 valine--tRNA ligase [Bacteroidales bacterium]
MSTEINTKYDPIAVEDKWYDFWNKNGFFHSEPDGRPAYSIVIPPPNVTGVLHMGHMLNNTIQDVLVRRARMKGFNAVWVPGTDHASIATEAKVVNYLKEQGIDKKDLTRDEFLKHAWEWKEKYGGIILKQLRKLGASCDWERTKFTMDPDMSEAVIDVFVDLYNKGKIYRGVRMVNWDPKALTAVSDEEVIYKELQSKLYYVRYQIEGEDNEYITIATTRPETILGDTAICMHPDDERYAKYKGKRAIVPLVNRSIPLIYDEYVEREFGTGALKITPAHDINDYNLGIKHHLETINIFNDNGTLSEKAQFLVGMDRFEAREAIVPMLEKAGNLVKVEDYVNKVGFSERTNEVIEPKLSMQWFCKMGDLAKPALDAVMNGDINFYPEKFKNTYAHWMENIKDWCISRQLWWGHRIPAYYLPNREFVVAHNADEALNIARQKYPELNLTINDLQQDEDVMDTWFSSWLWPLSVFDGIRNPENDEIKYYYPTSALITAPDIIFFWVARMIMAGMEWRGQIPFKDVYFTGTVRDKLHRKMSKQLGNSPDPIMLMEKYGADGVRFGMLLSSPAGNDLLFDESLCEQGRNFSNKLWNAFRLVKGWEIDATIEQPLHTATAVKWMQNRINEVLAEVEENFKRYRLSETLMSIYKLIWDDFCSCFLEVVKPAYQKPIDGKTFNEIVDVFEKLMTILHPFMPFITEELWHSLRERSEKEAIMLVEMPEIADTDQKLLDEFANARKVIEQVRRIRNEKNIAQKHALKLNVYTDQESCKPEFDAVIAKLCNIENIEYKGNCDVDGASFIENNVQYSVPLTGFVDAAEEIKKLESDLKYAEGFLQNVLKKLSNERFVNSAPQQVVEMERKKQSDAEEKIRIIKEQLSKLK